MENERCTVSRAGEGVLKMILSEAIATDEDDIACGVGLASGAVVNVTRGENDREWEIRFPECAEPPSQLVADDVPGAIQNVTFKRTK
jgi:hypothetical protein